MDEIKGLPEFLAARVDELEAAAKACPLHDWEATGPAAGYIGPRDWYLVGRVSEHTGKLLAQGSEIHDDPDHACLMHAALNDPAAVLRDVEADRALLKRYRDSPGSQHHDYDGGYESALEDVLKIRAERFRDHPDYRAAWKL